MTIPLEVLDLAKQRGIKPLRYSSITTFEECPRKFLYRYRLGLNPKGYDSALGTGDFFHQLMRRLILGTPEQTAFSQVEALVSQLKQDLGTGFGADDLLDSPRLDGLFEQIDDDFAKAKAMAHITQVLHPLKLDTFTIHSVEKKLESQYRLPGLECTLSGTLDLVAQRNLTNDYWIIDYKTTSGSPWVRAQTAALSLQPQIYRVLLANHLGPTAQVKGAIHYVIKKPGIKYCPLTKDKSGFSSYLTRIREWYEDLAEKGAAELARGETGFSLPIVESWATIPRVDQEFDNRLHPVSTANGEKLTDGSLSDYPKRGDYVCTKFNRVCPYMELCRTDPVLWPGLVGTKYKFQKDDTPDTQGEDE